MEEVKPFPWPLYRHERRPEKRVTIPEYSTTRGGGEPQARSKRTLPEHHHGRGVDMDHGKYAPWEEIGGIHRI